MKKYIQNNRPVYSWLINEFFQNKAQCKLLDEDTLDVILTYKSFLFYFHYKKKLLFLANDDHPTLILNYDLYK